MRSSGSAGDRRSRYLDTALALFIERGYHGVSMDEVVAVAGGSKATLYRYFPSKQDLFSAMVDRLQATMAGAPPDDVVGDLALADGLRALGRATAEAALSTQAVTLLRLAVGEQSRFPELGRILFDLGPARSYERFRSFLDAKQASGEVDVADTQVAAEQFLAGLVGHQQLRMLLIDDAPTPEQIGQRVDAAVRTFVRTYGTTA